MTITLRVPSTIPEVADLVRQRRELSEQLSSVSERRSELATQLGAEPAGSSTRAGIEARIKVLDDRILQIETDLALAGRRIATAPGDLIAIAERDNRPQQSDGDFEEGLFVGWFTLLGLVAVVYAWKRFRRRKAPARQTAMPTESSERMERLERGMEAIAIEIERVSEGQRFVTKLLSESAPVGVSHRIHQAEPVSQRSSAAQTP